MKLRGAIFDMDGTLVDSMGMWYRIDDTIFEMIGQELTPEVRKVLCVKSLSGSVDYCLEHYPAVCTRQELLDGVMQHIRAFYGEEAEAKPGAAEFLTELQRRGVKICLATATNRPEVEIALKHTGLDRYISFIRTCEEAGADKTRPDIFEQCLPLLSCSREECIVFEDSPIALRTAREAGFPTAGVCDPHWESAQEELRSTADYYLPSFTEWKHVFPDLTQE